MHPEAVMNTKQSYEILGERLHRSGIDIDDIKKQCMQVAIETPSWGYGDSGTRFGVFRQPGAPRNIFEKLEDAAQVHRFTGIAPSVAIHIPWDKVDDFNKLAHYADDLHLKIGAVNPNLFQDPMYEFGSITHTNPEVRKAAVDHMIECIQIAEQVGSRYLSLWFADGTNYPGQGDFRQRKHRAEESLMRVYEHLPKGVTMLIEYKPFEPAFYHTDLADWGMAYSICLKLGPQAKVLIDLGHHAHGTNIEHLVAFLIDEKRLGGFHLNARKYADDDLTVGSINPYELFLIFKEIIAGQRDPEVQLQMALMLDQSHVMKPKIEAMIQSVLTVQAIYTKALLIDLKGLTEAQAANDTVTAEEILKAAYETDVRPILQVARLEANLDPDPLNAYRQSGYFEQTAEKRAKEKAEVRGWAAPAGQAP